MRFDTSAHVQGMRRRAPRTPTSSANTAAIMIVQRVLRTNAVAMRAYRTAAVRYTQLPERPACRECGCRALRDDTRSGDCVCTACGLVQGPAHQATYGARDPDLAINHIAWAKQALDDSGLHPALARRALDTFALLRRTRERLNAEHALAAAVYDATKHVTHDSAPKLVQCRCA